MGSALSVERLTCIVTDEHKDRTDEVLAALGTVKTALEVKLENLRAQNSAEHGKFDAVLSWIHRSMQRMLKRLGFLAGDDDQ